MAYWKDDRPPEKTDKRNGPDLLVKWVRLASLLCWFFFFLTILVWDSARPQFYTILDAQYGKIARDAWDKQDLNLAFVFSVITFIFTVISLLFNSQRLKRKHDRISISLVICMIGSGIMMVGFFIYYLGNI